MNTENQRHTRLQKLSGSDFEIAEGQPDIRGWKVEDDSGKRFGKVDELIFDYQSRKVRYIVVDLGSNDFNLQDRKVLVPIGIAELHKDNDDVILNGVTTGQMSILPAYEEDRFDTSHETDVRNVFGGLGTAPFIPGEDEPDFYEHEHFNEDNLYRNRRSDMKGSDLNDTNQGPGKAIQGGDWVRSKNVDQ